MILFRPKFIINCNDFDFDFFLPFLDGVVPRSASNHSGVYISQLIRFSRASSHVTDFNTCNKWLTQKLLKQGYRYHKFRKTLSKFYCQKYDLISKIHVGLKFLLQQGLSEPEFYGELVYNVYNVLDCWLKHFLAQCIKIISHYKKVGYNINVLLAWWSTKSWLAALLSSLIARRWIRLQTL